MTGSLLFFCGYLRVKYVATLAGSVLLPLASLLPPWCSEFVLKAIQFVLIFGKAALAALCRCKGPSWR